MRRTSLLAACLLAATVRLSASAEPAELYPFAALITDKEGPLCTGALVAPRAVLTSASCVASASPSIVYVGMHNFFLDGFRRRGDYKVHRVEGVKVHPDYTQWDLQQNNLALIQLKRASRTDPVALPDTDFIYPTTSTNVTALGYGSLSADGFYPQLHADELSLLPEEECTGLQTAYGKWWAAPQTLPAGIQACTGLSHSFRACASGNKGAPLLLPGGRGGAPLQLGLLTTGFSCSSDPAVASASSPALYTWLPRYTDWLQQQLAGMGGGPAQAEEEAGAE